MSNIRPYVIINGVDSRTIQGLLITSLPPISKPAQRTLTETIDGRDGDSSIKLGYSAYDKSLGIALTFGYNVDEIIAFFNSEGTIVFSNEPDKLYNFEIFEQIDLEKLIRFKTGTVTIHTQPFKFSTSEEPIEFTDKEFTVVNNGNINSRPNIVITGEGLATMQINGKNALNIDFGDAEQTLLIDSEGMNAYYTENIKKVEAEITPKQDLHGFDSPFIDSDIVNKVPYLSRALAGTAERIGNYEYNKLVGGTVAFNQLIKTQTASVVGEYHGVVFTNVTNGVNINGTTDSVINSIYFDNTDLLNSTNGRHKYILFGSPSGSSGDTFYLEPLVTSGADWCKGFPRDYGNGCIFEPKTLSDEPASIYGIRILINPNVTLNNKVFRCILIDLTQMLGATIADYIYSLEQANTGAGVAYFRALFSADYYPYNAGELMSVKASAHVTKKAGGAVIQTVALDPNLELRGVLKLDENNKLYYDGDTYSADGSVSRCFIKYTITGNETVSTWVDNTSNYFGYHYGGELTIPNFPVKTGVNEQGLINKVYAVKFANADKTAYCSAQNRIAFINDDYQSQAEWLASLIGLEILMEIATPTSESAQAFNNPIAIDANGSEEFTDSRAVAIPVGHESYYANICDIEGFTEVNLTRTGANLLAYSPISQGVSIAGGEGDFTITSGTQGGFNCAYFNITNLKGLGTLYFSGEGERSQSYSSDIAFQLVYYSNGSYHFDAMGFYGNNNKCKVKDVSFVLSNDIEFAYLQCYINNTGENSHGKTANFKNIIISKAQNSNFNEYAGEIFNKQFEQEGEPVTVYGGKYNFTTGLLEVSYKRITRTWGDFGYKDSIGNFTRGVLLITSEGMGINHNLKDYCNVAKCSYDYSDSDHFFIETDEVNTAVFMFLPNDLPDSTQIVICYELAEPTFIELDPETISALLGINNFYADTGEVTITFVNDGQDETQTGLIVTFDLDESDFNRGDLANRLVSGNYDNIRLKAGANSIKFTGSVSAVGFNKYSRWL